MIEGLARLLVGHPVHVLLVALLHFGLWAAIAATAMRESPRGNVLWIPAVLWLAYAVWEWVVYVVTPEADIRVDLLLIWPLLAMVTVWAIMRTAIAWRSARRREPRGP